MDAHRSRSLGMAALVFILISLTAAVFRGAAPVRAEDATTPTPIEINGDTAKVEVKLYTDENRKVLLGNTPVLSTDTLYGSFSADFKPNHTPSPTQNVAEYSLPSNVKLLKDEGGLLYDGLDKEAGTWKCENNKLIFTFDQNWINTNPSDVHVGVDFSFKLANVNVGSGNTTKVEFPGTAGIDISTKDGDVAGTKEGKFSQSGGEGKVTWTLKLEVASYAQKVCLTDVLGNNFSFVPGSFKLNGETLKQQPSINGQTATLNLGNLSKGTHTITYDSVMSPDVSVGNKVWINQLDGSKNNASWTWGGDRRGGLEKPGLANDFRYDMINKSDGTGTPSDIKWTVTLNNGDIKTDMNGYTFTDTLDKKQKYIGSYTVYRGLNKSEKVDEGDLSNSAETFSYTFRDLKEAEKYQPYQIEYHTQMTDQNSYDPVTNTAGIKREGTTSPSGTSMATFRRGIVEQLITKELESHDENGNATWITHVKIPETVDVSQVQILDTFKSTYLQHLKVESLAVKIGDTTLSEGTSTSGDYYFYTRDEVTKGNKINFNIQLRATDRVMDELRANGYQIDVVYTTVTDNLDGQYWNLAAVQFPFAGKNFKQYSSEPYYIINNSETPDVDKSSDGYTWDGKFDWSQVEPGSTEKGAWIATWTVYANRYKTPAGECYGAGKLDGQPITIKDTLPADGTMSFVPGSATYTLYANPYDERKEAEREVATNLDVEGSVSGNEVTFSIPTTALGKYAGYAKLTYKTAIKRSVLNTSTNSTTLKNSASAESGSKTFNSGSGTVTIKNNVLQKTGDQVANNNRIKYTILVNESAVNLKSDSDFLELVDVMDAKCTLVPSSVKVYQHKDKDWSLLDSDDYSVGAETIKDESGAACTKMTLRVPDEEYLKVEYKVIPAGNEGDAVSLSNTASLAGVFDGNAKHENNWIIRRASGSAGGSGYGVTVTKVDKSDIEKKLSGATFSLYEVDVNKALADGIGAAKTVFQEVPTGDNGTATFGTADQRMEAYTLYCLEETKAPQGYNVIGKPVWIMLKGQYEQQYQQALTKVEDLRRTDATVEIPTANTDIAVYDAPYSGKATVSAIKVLQGSSLREGQFSFVLKDANGKVLQTAKNGADGTISFNLDYSKARTYEYTICEVVPEDAVNNVKNHIAYDTTEHKVKVVVTNGERKLDTKVTYDGDDSTTPPTFTNKYSTTLPEAGGAGLTMTYLAGASLLCFAATWMHARRHRDQGRGGSRE